MLLSGNGHYTHVSKPRYQQDIAQQYGVHNNCGRQCRINRSRTIVWPMVTMGMVVAIYDDLRGCIRKPGTGLGGWAGPPLFNWTGPTTDTTLRTHSYGSGVCPSLPASICTVLGNLKFNWNNHLKEAGEFILLDTKHLPVPGLSKVYNNVPPSG